MTFETLIREAQGTSEEILDKVIRYLKYLKKEAEGKNASKPEGQKAKTIRDLSGSNQNVRGFQLSA